MHEIYTEEILSVVCPVCLASPDSRCQSNGLICRSKPHRERLWKARGYRWYCFECDSMVEAEHIKHVCSIEAQTGSCAVLATAAMSAA